MFNWKVFMAEFIGTFALVFIGSAAGIYTDSLLTVALAHGLTLAAFIYVYGHISGTHINPAVTFGMALNKSISWGDAIWYWVAQFTGAIFAASLLHTFIVLIPEAAFDKAATTGLLVSRATVPFYYGLVVEALLTFFLMNAVLHAAVDGKAGSFAGLAIGLTLLVAIIAGGPLTGGSLNPARSFGPALFSQSITVGVLDYQNFRFYQIYFLGPLLGSTLAAVLFQYMKSKPGRSADSGMEDSGSEQVKNPFMGKPAVRKGKK